MIKWSSLLQFMITRFLVPLLKRHCEEVPLIILFCYLSTHCSATYYFPSAPKPGACWAVLERDSKEFWFFPFPISFSSSAPLQSSLLLSFLFHSSSGVSFILLPPLCPAVSAMRQGVWTPLLGPAAMTRCFISIYHFRKWSKEECSVPLVTPSWLRFLELKIFLFKPLWCVWFSWTFYIFKKYIYIQFATKHESLGKRRKGWSLKLKTSRMALAKSFYCRKPFCFLGRYFFY